MVAASVGAVGTNERARGWSSEMHAGARSSIHSRSASDPPSPCGVMVAPIEAARSAGDRGASRGGGSMRMRSRA